MQINFYELNEQIPKLKYVIIFAKYNNEWVFVRHRDRETWEISGGHIETDETPDHAARRELMEETGAINFEIEPICNYSVQINENINYGRLYFAKIENLNKTLNYEISEIKTSNTLPDKLTYSEIQPVLLRKVIQILENKNQ